METSVYEHIIKEILLKTDDGFVIVDTNCIVLYINQPYCDFLGKKPEEIVGFHIQKVITNTTMPQVIASRYNGNADYVMKYCHADIREGGDHYAIANRFCIFDENGNVVAAAAQMKFRERILSSAQRITQEEFDFYKEEYQSKISGKYSLSNIIGDDPLFLELKAKAEKAAQTDFPVLLTGKTGTGKEVFAKGIHSGSHRAGKPIIALNCAAIPAELLESELFGYVEGAFTGAKKGGSKGKFELADGGTLFLDEIGDMPLTMQAKLLRVLQEMEIQKVGSEQTIQVDVRIITATRQDLPKMVEAGTFREDLYYRINVINLEMVPLHGRSEDILQLATHFLNQLNVEYRTTITFSNEVKRCFQLYHWPGNVRELKNTVTSAYASSEGFVIDLTTVPEKISSLYHGTTATLDEEKKLKSMVQSYETTVIRNTLKKHNWVVQAAAQELGIDRGLLYKKMNKYGIQLIHTGI